MSTQIDRLTELAKEDPKRQFYSIAHMITFGHCMRHSEDYERKPAREWTASRTRNTNGTSLETSKLSMRGSGMASIRHNLCAESISPRKTGNRDQSRFPPWRIRSCRRPWSKY